MNTSLGTESKRYPLVVGDVLLFYAALFLTLVVRYGQEFSPNYWQLHFWPFTVVLGLLLTIFYIDQLYDLTVVTRGHLIGRLVRSSLVTGVLASSFFYIGYNRLFTIQPQRVLILQLGLTVLFVYGWHLLINKFAISSRLANGVLLIGGGTLSNDVLSRTKQHPELGLQVRAWLTLNPQDQLAESLEGVGVYDQLDQLKEICIRHKINIIASTVHPREHPELLSRLFACRPLRIKFFDITTLYEKITGKVPVKTIEQIWFLENLGDSSRHAYEIGKRGLDILVALALLITTLPFWPLIALIIRLDSPSSIFFRQQRVGKNSLSFWLIKFRTMVAQAETQGAVWAQANDPRVTRVGRFLRATRIDELPQVLNILRGEMSLIGPRPERPEFVSQLQEEIPFYTERLLIKPGLTGWAQVEGPAYGGSKSESLEKLQYDLFYIKNRSLGLDLSILLKTIRTVLSRRGQ